MCGRFTLSSPAEVVAEMFDLVEIPDLQPRYNIAPTQVAPAIRLTPESEARKLEGLRWGLIPSWAKDPGIGSRMINARGETVDQKPSFRSSLRRRRCLIVADGFYEWKRVDRKKQPYYIHLASRAPFAMAGLWEHWEDGEGGVIESCAIITTTPNELVSSLHDRMPVLLPTENFDRWLDPRGGDVDDLTSLLKPYPAEEMAAYPVGAAVNKPSFDNPECIQALT